MEEITSREMARRRIKGLLEKFIGRKEKKITPNHIIGQVRSAVQKNILSIDECWDIIKQVEEEIKTSKLFPTVLQKEKLERLNIIVNKLKEENWWQK